MGYYGANLKYHRRCLFSKTRCRRRYCARCVQCWGCILSAFDRCREDLGEEQELVPVDSMSSSFGDPPLCASGQHVSIVWANRSASGAITSNKVRRSTDGGQTWLEPQILVQNNPLYPLALPSIALRGQDSYVTMSRFVSSQLQYFLTISSDGGETWGPVRQITFISESHRLGSLQATSKAVHLTFERDIPPSGWEIAYTVSTDKGITWATEQVLSTVDNYEGWKPNVAADETGNVYVSWQDAKYGSIGGFAGTVLFRHSPDNGQTWLPEVRVSSLASARKSTLCINNSFVHAAWDDERNGFQDGTIQYLGSSDRGASWCNEETTIGGPIRRALDVAAASAPFCVYLVWSSDRSTGGDTTRVFFRRGDVLTGVDGSGQLTPSAFAVSPAYPNPFNSSTTIEYAIPNKGDVAIGVYSILGQQVAALTESCRSPGTYRFSLDASYLSSGMYAIVLSFPRTTRFQWVMLVR